MPEVIVIPGETEVVTTIAEVGVEVGAATGAVTGEETVERIVEVIVEVGHETEPVETGARRRSTGTEGRLTATSVRPRAT